MRRRQLYALGGTLLCTLVVGSVVILAYNADSHAHAQSQGRDNNRQLVQPESRVQSGDKEVRVALVVGNSAYRNASRLTNPVNDARDMADALRSLGFVVLLREDQTAEQMREAITQFGRTLKAGGQVGLFYYAGHGVQVNGKNYLIPVEVDALSEDKIESEAVDVNRVLGEMEAAKNGLNVIILDACRTNPFARPWRAAEGGLAEMKAPTGTYIAYATLPGMVANDGPGRNGLFTAELLRQMRVPGVTIEQIIKRVRRTVKEQTGGRQVPWESSTLDGDFYFTGPVSDPATAEAEFWRSVKDSQNAKDFEDYLREYPNGIHSSLARNSLRSLADKAKETKSLSSNASAQPTLARPAFSAERLKQSEALIKSGDAQRMKGEFDAAIRDLTEAIRLNPNDPMAYAVRGAAYHARGTEDLAILDFTESIRIYPEFSWAFSQRCIAYISKGAKELALSDINEVIRIEPKNYGAYKIRATIYDSLGQHDAARADEQREINDLNESIRKSPQDSDMYAARCNAFMGRLQLDLALADCNEAIRLNPRSFGAYAVRGTIYYLKGSYDQAAVDLTEAIRLDPSYYWSYEKRAEVYERVGLSALAAEDRKKVTALKSNH